MSQRTLKKIADKGHVIAQTAEATDFATIFGSNAQPSWFQWLMSHVGTYMFSVALAATIVKAFSTIYHFATAPNKNINEEAHLGWGIVQTVAVVTAIAFSFTGLAALTLATPVILVASLAADTVRNIGLFAWNAIRLGMLRFKVRHALSDSEPNLTKLRYADLKQQYVSKMKQHGVGAIIGLIVTAAVSVIFLMPHIGLGFVGAVGFVVGGIKVTVAGILGLSAAIATVAPFIPPVLKKLGSGLKKIGAWFKQKLTSKEKASLIMPAPQPQQASQQAQKKAATLKITTQAQLVAFKAKDPIKDFSLFGKHSEHRELIMAQICETKKDLARSTLEEMIDKKVTQLHTELENNARGYNFVGTRQRPRRLQKLHALLLIKYQLKKEAEPDADLKQYWETITKNYAQHFTHQVNFNEVPDITTLIGLLGYIKDTFPAVSASYLLEVSDTLNILHAVYTYEERFVSGKRVEDPVVNPNKVEVDVAPEVVLQT